MYNNPFNKVASVFDIIHDYDVLLFDLWGVIFAGDNLPFLNVVDTINNLSKTKPTYFITNSTELSHTTTNKLKEVSIDVEHGQLFTAGDILRLFLLQHTDDLLFYYIDKEVDSSILNGISNFGVTDDINEATALIITASSHETNRSLFDSELKIAAKNKLPAFCPNPDFIAIVNKELYVCSRYFAQRYERMGGSVKYFGKPENSIFEHVYQQINCSDKNKILMIGDTLYTDILGAKNFGIKSALVLTGNTGNILDCQNTIDQKLAKLEKICCYCNIFPDHIIHL